MKTVYIVHHVQEIEDGDEEVKLIGIYSSQKNAEATVARLSEVTGFCDTRDGFHIEGYELNKDHWADGYISWAEATTASEPTSTSNHSNSAK